MHNRINVSSGTSWEESVGYSRAVKLGNLVEISGTVAVDGDGNIAGEDAYSQTRFILEKIQTSLVQLGASLEQVIRTRIYVTDISQWEAIGRAHREVFAAIKPATTMVEVSKLIRPELLVEIEATAVAGRV